MLGVIPKFVPGVIEILTPGVNAEFTFKAILLESLTPWFEFYFSYEIAEVVIEPLAY